MLRIREREPGPKRYKSEVRSAVNVRLRIYNDPMEAKLCATLSLWIRMVALGHLGSLINDIDTGCAKSWP